VAPDAIEAVHRLLRVVQLPKLGMASDHRRLVDAFASARNRHSYVRRTRLRTSGVARDERRIGKDNVARGRHRRIGLRPARVYEHDARSAGAQNRGGMPARTGIWLRLLLGCCKWQPRQTPPRPAPPARPWTPLRHDPFPASMTASLCEPVGRAAQLTFRVRRKM
jgi:hypothetical protein